MDRDPRLVQLDAEIEELNAWIVDHPHAEYEAKKEIIHRIGVRLAEKQEIINKDISKFLNK